jgi:hypothetical protein
MLEMGEKKINEFSYTREQLKAFFQWQMVGALQFYENDHNHEEKAKRFAESRPYANGYIIFQKFFGGKRFYWIEKGKAEPIEAMECFLKDCKNILKD